MPFQNVARIYEDITADCTFAPAGVTFTADHEVKVRFDDPKIELYGFHELAGAMPAGAFVITLPSFVGQIPLAGAQVQVGPAEYNDLGTPRHWIGTVRFANLVDLEFLHTEAANFGIVSNVAPFGFGAGDQIIWHLSAERVGT